MVLHPISTVEVIETMPPLELSLLLRLLEPREDEGGRKEKNGNSRKIRSRVRQFITASFSRFLFPPAL